MIDLSGMVQGARWANNVPTHEMTWPIAPKNAPLFCYNIDNVSYALQPGLNNENISFPAKLLKIILFSLIMVKKKRRQIDLVGTCTALYIFSVANMRV